jgi:hypothetical protein
VRNWQRNYTKPQYKQGLIILVLLLSFKLWPNKLIGRPLLSLNHTFIALVKVHFYIKNWPLFERKVRIWRDWLIISCSCIGIVWLLLIWNRFTHDLDATDLCTALANQTALVQPCSNGYCVNVSGAILCQCRPGYRYNSTYALCDGELPYCFVWKVNNIC